MKKIIILSFVLAAVIILGMNVNSSARISNTGNVPTQTYIQYQVNIHPNWGILHNQCPMFVVLTDGISKRYIGPPKLYQQGINTYYFSEIGPVTGVRTARLFDGSKDQSDDVCYAVSLSDLKTGTFYSGQNYIFDLYGSARDIIKQDNSSVNQ